MASLLCLVFASCALGASSNAEALRRWVAEHPVIRVAMDAQHGAEVSGSQTNPLVSEYLALTARNAGVRFQMVRTDSWEASVKAFRERRVDVLPSTSDRLLAADVGNQALLSVPFYVGRTLIVSRTVGPARLTMRDLEGKKVAFKGGGAYEAWLKREYPSVQRLPLADIHQVLVAVESGIADVAVGADVAYYPIVRRDYALSLRVAGEVSDMPVTVRVAVQPDEPQLVALIEQAMRGVGPKESEAIIERWLQMAYLRAPTAAQVLSAYGLEIGLVAALVVALLFAMVQMRRAQLASRRGEQQKTMLLAVMSHEVRNAVNAVASSIDLMSRKPLEGSQRDLMALALSSSRNLQSLLRSALDFSRNEASGFTPDLTACDAYAVARDIIEGHRAAIEARGVEAKLDLPMGPLPWLLLDETRLRQVIDNLLGNAVKFTVQGHVGVALWQDAGENAPDEVRHLFVEVFDTGEGIPEARQKDVFRPFAQAHGKRSRRLGGTGLGLSICREIVRQLGGSLTLSSELGVGTTVRVVLPTSLVPAAPEDDIDEGGVEVRAPLGLVLLVEDHPANRQIIAAQLLYLGYDSVAVDRGQAAIDVFEPGRFDAVLLDCELPDMHGYDVAVELRAREAAIPDTHARFVAVSASSGEEHVRRCEAAGIDVVLGKPLALAALRGALAKPVDHAAALEAFQRESLADLARIREMLSSGDPEGALPFAHRMRGGALVCGAAALAEELESLEAAIAQPRVDVSTLQGMVERLAAMIK